MNSSGGVPDERRLNHRDHLMPGEEAILGILREAGVGEEIIVKVQDALMELIDNIY